MDTSFDEVKDPKEEETGAWYKKWCKPLMLGLLLAPVVVFLFLGPCKYSTKQLVKLYIKPQLLNILD